jgi:hypothetical protein
MVVFQTLQVDYKLFDEIFMRGKCYHYFACYFYLH